MRYMNAAERVLSQTLVKEIQKYINGDLLYILHSSKDEKKKWGEKSGYRAYYRSRNSEMKRDYKEGQSIMELSEEYGFSCETVKKIIYSREIY